MYQPKLICLIIDRLRLITKLDIITYRFNDLFIQTELTNIITCIDVRFVKDLKAIASNWHNDIDMIYA